MHTGNGLLRNKQAMGNFRLGSASGGGRAEGGNSGMTKFEYKFELNLGVDDDGVVDNVEEELDKLGAEGWELIAVSPCGKDNSYTGYWFMRPLNSK